MFWTTRLLEENAEKKRNWKLLLTCIRSYLSITVSLGRKCSFLDKHLSKPPLSTCAMHNCSFYGKASAQFRCPALIGYLQMHTGTSSLKPPSRRGCVSRKTMLSREFGGCC